MQDGRSPLARRQHDLARAGRLGLAFTPLDQARLDPRIVPSRHLAAARVGTMATLSDGSLALVPTRMDEAFLRDWLNHRSLDRSRIVATSHDDLTALYLRDSESRLVRDAVDGLAETRPAMSAKHVLGHWQVFGLPALIGFTGAGLLLDAAATLAWFALGLSLVFMAATTLRVLALVGRVPGSAPWVELDDSQLPAYTILVPLYREANVVSDLITALDAIDYPTGKLDIKLLLEADDTQTRAAIAACDLGAHYNVLALPDIGPRTKPRALATGLALARGDLVCVFDAEDRPEPEQLRQAAGAFALSGPRVAALQARLAYRNWNQSLMTRQFAIEYSAQFDVIVPMLAWFGFPLPLGGTSNHFRIGALREAGGWDPYNVTEDADLGIRLARLGFGVGAIDSTSFEEAPAGIGAWLTQRTRWMKGWMQTVLVHTRNPFVLIGQLGLSGSFGLVGTVGANLVSAIAHPLAIALLAMQISGGVLFAGDDVLTAAIATFATVNLVFGYAVALACAGLGLYRRPMAGLVWHLALTPLYWLLSALAFLLALVDLVRRPHFWAKTEHGKARRTAPAGLRRKRPARG